MKHLLKLFTLSGLFLFPGFSFAQKRNQEMRELNQIVEMMNAFSFCNQQWYFDAVQLQRALNASTEKIQKSYFYCSKTQRNGFSYYSGIEDAFHFQEITPNAQKQVPSYQTEYIPWLRSKEQVRSLLSKQRINPEVSPFLWDYLTAADSLFATHTDLNTYVSDQLFLSDPLFGKAEFILEKHQQWFKVCHENSMKLDSVLQQYVQKKLPPLKTHLALQNGLQELTLSMNLLADWERLLYADDQSKNTEYDSRLRALNAAGLKKDSLYLFKTRGYGNLSSGFWLHTRYRTFYTSMQSTIYWFASSKHQPEKPFLKASQKAYNDFLRSYNSIVEDYNDYIAIADGLTFTRTSECCLSKSEIDTNQNVLLMKPRLLYKFELTPKTLPKVITETPEILSPDEALIHRALPHHLVYLLDASSSMNESEKLAHLKENASYLVGIQRSVDQISIVTFSGKSETVLQAVPCDQKEQITEKIKRIHALGQTNIQEGFKTVKNILESNKLLNGINTVLILTDGEFPLTEQVRSTIKELRINKIGICFVYLGKKLGKKNSKLFEKQYTDLGVIFYDINQLDLKEALLKIATE
ncbi:VWA domain-containing protein [Fluviicola sp.]|uniref:VWA domain-containing protein n=1 Tax=Fluviicola sp. TaxID=1917219 RepID=UPI00262C6C60|nr:VWA domain-containing protein [Fluviicola sp.]